MEQTDLVLEAKHLDLFNANFGGPTWSDCSFPRVVHCVEDVLVRRPLVDDALETLFNCWFVCFLLCFSVVRGDFFVGHDSHSFRDHVATGFDFCV